MTKKEWFEDFKGRLDRLPNKDCQEAINFYEELYQDKLDQGLDPKSIIEGFPLPEDAAKKILDEVKEENLENTPEIKTYKEKKVKEKKEKTEKVKKEKRGKPMWLKIVSILIAFLIFIVLFSLSIVFICVFLSGFAVVVYGFVSLIYYIIIYFKSMGDLILNSGFALIVIASGFLLITLFGNLTRLCFKGVGQLCKR